MPVPLRACRAGALLCLVALIFTAASSCGQQVDFKQALQVTDISGGWYDFGIVDGKNKLVPTMSFRITKSPDAQVRTLDLNVHFKWIAPENPASKEEETELAEVFLQRVEFSDGNQTPRLTVRPDTGFTGDAPQTRAEMMTHRLFRDVRARVFAKQSSTTWVELASYDIPRVLISK
jgi:hypothetical protein